MWSLAAICVSWKDSRRSSVALIKRLTTYRHPLSGKWFFPGGVVEIGEQPSEAAARETLEEAGISVGKLSLLDVYTYREFWTEGSEGKHRDVALVVYEGFYEGGELASQEESEAACWVKKRDLRSYLDANALKSHLSARVRKRLGLRWD